MTIINLTSGSESTWIESTYPAHAEESVGLNDPFVVKFSKTIAMSALVSDNFKLVTSHGDEIADAFRAVDLNRDYNEITKTLTLRLANPLTEDTEYGFLIEGLFDPTGDDQDSPHYVLFVSSEFAGPLDTIVDEIDTITAIDNTLINSPIVVQTVVTQSTARVVRTTPTMGSYNLSAAYKSGVISVTFDLPINTMSYELEKRVVSSMESSWSDVAFDSEGIDPLNPASFLIQLTELQNGVWFEAGYEYRLTVLADTSLAVDVDTSRTIGTDYPVLFTGPLSPMFAAVKDVLFYFPALEPMEVAKWIYLSSKYAVLIDPQIDPLNPPRAAIDFALYSTLCHFGNTDDGAESVTIGDFNIKKKSGGSLGDKFCGLADKALSRLQRVGPVTTVKGLNYPGDFPVRDWR